MVLIDSIFCYYFEKYKANLCFLSLLLSEMISAYAPHTFIKAFPPHVYYVVTLPC